MENTVETTPATTTETPAAAPATSAPSSSDTASQRPRSFQEAFEQVAAAEESPAATIEETAATGQVAETDPASATHPSAKPQGPIPFEVHKTALDNARAKEREAVAAEWKPYEWAKSIPRESLDHMSNIAQRMTSDPIGFLEEFEKELTSHPTYGPQLRSRAGRMLASARGASPETEPSPDVDITDATGNVTGQTYSAKQLAARDAWLKRQLLTEIDQQYGLTTMKAEREQSVKAQEKAAALERDRNATVDAQAREILDLLDGDETHTADVLKTMTEHPDWSPRKCALHVRDTAIVAKRLQPKAQQAALDAIKQKAAGNTVTGTGTGTPPKRPTTAKELAAWMEAHA